METAIVTAIVSCVVSAVLGGILTFVVTRIKGLFKREKAVENGIQVLLRNQLIEYHDKYTEKGYCPIYAKENARRSYDAYHELGGNGVITKLFNDIMQLPEEPKNKE